MTIVSSNTESAKSLILRVLDIDLDFFLNKKHVSFGGTKGRLNKKIYISWNASEVSCFIENQCSLKKKVAGQVFDTHYEVLSALKDVSDRHGTVQFDIDHIDAHADLGFGDSSYMYIFKELLTLPIEDKLHSILGGGYGLNEGNFLLFAIACGLVASLSYIVPPKWATDIPPCVMKDFELNASAIQLKHYGNALSPLSCLNINQIPIDRLEVEVPFRIIDSSCFVASGEYDMFFLTKSPKYTPKTSDLLIPVLKRFMIENKSNENQDK